MPEYISRNGEWELVQITTDEMSTVVNIEPVFDPKVIAESEVIAEPESAIEESVAITETTTYNSEYDINQDGKVDAKDATLAAKVLNNAKKRIGRPKKSK
jgi:hypothetical protein